MLYYAKRRRKHCPNITMEKNGFNNIVVSVSKLLCFCEISMNWNPIHYIRGSFIFFFLIDLMEVWVGVLIRV